MIILEFTHFRLRCQKLSHDLISSLKYVVSRGEDHSPVGNFIYTIPVLDDFHYLQPQITRSLESRRLFTFLNGFTINVQCFIKNTSNHQRLVSKILIQ